MKTTIKITLEDFKLIKSFYPDFTRIDGLTTNDCVIGWSEVMPVVSKVNTLSLLKGLDLDLLRSMHDWILEVCIENAFMDIVSIIKWYNTQKTN